MNERIMEDILAKYSNFIEEGLVLEGRQVIIHGHRMDLIFRDISGQRLIVILKAGPISDQDVQQFASSDSFALLCKSPDQRVMLIGTRVPPTVRKIFEHYGIAWKEIAVLTFLKHLEAAGDKDINLDAVNDRPASIAFDGGRSGRTSPAGASTHFIRYVQHYPKATAVIRNFTPIGTPQENELVLAGLVAKAIDRSVDMSIDIVRCMRRDGGQLSLSQEDRDKLELCAGKGRVASAGDLNVDSVEIDVPAMLIRIKQTYREGMSSEELFEVTRGIWKVGTKRERVQYAFAVFKGIIKEVYKVNQWFSAGTLEYRHRQDWQAINAKKGHSDRWEFDGAVAEASVRDRFVGKSCAQYFKWGNISPTTYVNCD